MLRKGSKILDSRIPYYMVKGEPMTVRDIVNGFRADLTVKNVPTPGDVRGGLARLARKGRVEIHPPVRTQGGHIITHARYVLISRW